MKSAMASHGRFLPRRVTTALFERGTVCSTVDMGFIHPIVLKEKAECKRSDIPPCAYVIGNTKLLVRTEILVERLDGIINRDEVLRQTFVDHCRACFNELVTTDTRRNG